MAPSLVACEHAGVEIHGVDLRKLSVEDLEFVKEQFVDRGVVFFRDQKLSPEEHLELARQFGTINVNRFFAKVPGHPQIAQVLKEKTDTQNIGEGFHTDHSYDVEPALGSILVARDVPKCGGDTVFVDMCKAFDTLPLDLKNAIDGKNAVHSSRHVFKAAAPAVLPGRVGNPENASQDAVHPVVLTHPQSGRKILFVNPTFTLHFEGMTVEESRPLLERLYYHAAQPQHLHRFNWRAGSVAMWDNRSTWHMAINDYHGERREMHRVTIDGCKISGLNDPERLSVCGLNVDASLKYNPHDELNTRLRDLALNNSVPQLSKL